MLKILNPRRTLTVLAILAVTIIAFSYSKRVYGIDQDILKLNRFVQTSKSSAPSMKMFREGRDLIEAQDWPQASKKFNDFIAEYPKDKDLDAALYWFAYALQKQGKKDEAAEPLLRLIKNFPNSSWRREAEAMLVVLGRGDAIKQALDRDNCEIKILALQSLFEADEDRAINFVTDVLKANQTECPTLKYAAVSLLGSHGGARSIPMLADIARNQADLRLRLTAIKRLGEQNSDNIADELSKLYDADRTKEIRVQILRAFSEMNNTRAETKLIDVARAGDDLEFRQLALRYLGEQHGDASLNELIRIFDADHSPEIRAQILRALSERDEAQARAKLLDIARKGDTMELRVEAIRRLGERGSSSVDDLLSLYATEKDPAIKQGLIRAYGEINDPRAVAKLFDIARSGESLELRAYAIRRLSEHDDAQVIPQLISLYDSEPVMDLKAMIIRTLGESEQSAAVRKLIAIARSDPSVDLRKMAVRVLGESKNPEALKFLEDLLK
ncbi:MAG TPA: HEAT repeat domain-containing protein [Pyrinomonadaceae bacterium]|nr:HEAT repeat domain-containing protein [Pyrinomonadaceae bacterium]